MKSYMSELTKRLQKIVKPITKAEERQTMKSVNSYINEEYSRTTVAIHFRILGAELWIDKSLQQDTTSQRLIRVLVADYGNRRNLEFLVDIKGKILQVQNYRGLQPAFHKDEIKEARTIVKRDNRIADTIKSTNGKTTTFVSAFVPEIISNNSTRPSRLVGLRYVSVQKGATASSFLLLAKVIVDLSEQSIISFKTTE